MMSNEKCKITGFFVYIEKHKNATFI